MFYFLMVTNSAACLMMLQVLYLSHVILRLNICSVVILFPFRHYLVLSYNPVQICWLHAFLETLSLSLSCEGGRGDGGGCGVPVHWVYQIWASFFTLAVLRQLLCFHSNFMLSSHQVRGLPCGRFQSTAFRSNWRIALVRWSGGRWKTWPNQRVRRCAAKQARAGKCVENPLGPLEALDALIGLSISIRSVMYIFTQLSVCHISVVIQGFFFGQSLPRISVGVLVPACSKWWSFRWH